MPLPSPSSESKDLQRHNTGGARGQSGVSNPFRGERDHREHTAKRCWKACPYDLHRFPIVGRGLAPAVSQSYFAGRPEVAPYDLQRLSTVGEGSPLPRFNKSKTVCSVILERSEGSADGFLHFLLSII